MNLGDTVQIHVQPGNLSFLTYQIISDNGQHFLQGIVRKVKMGKVHVAVKRRDGQTERLLVPVGAIRQKGESHAPGHS